jgi:hypothetical protein
MLMRGKKFLSGAPGIFLIIPFSCVFALTLSCGESPMMITDATSVTDGGGGNGGDTLDDTGYQFPQDDTKNAPPPPPVEEGITCPDPVELAKLPTCCEDNSGHCVPSDTIPEGFSNVVATCDGGKCVPDSVIMSLANAGAFTPKKCVSVLGAEGRCISTCIPEVGQNMALLPVDICEPDERCSPCINPLNQEDTGICNGDISCGASDTAAPKPSPDPDPEPDPEPVDSCANPPTEPALNLNSLNVCCPGAHCLPKQIVESMQPGSSTLLASCDGGIGLCVPDQILVTGGLVPPATCTSVGGSEGRCMSTCVEAVAKQGDKLPVDICAEGERCSPCCDPYTGESTGACDTQCDEGPSEVCNGVPLFPTCCVDGKGHCIDKELIPDKQEKKLKKKYCENKQQLCVPDVMQDLNWKGKPCIGKPLFGNPYQGVCIPKCLKLPELFMDQNACPEHYICAQCKGPFGGNTGAPGCPGT